MFPSRSTRSGVVGVAAVALATMAVFAILQTRSTATLMPHGFCIRWTPSLLWLHVLSDGLIGLSYLAISATLIYLVRTTRRDMPFDWVFTAFGIFIVACGATHFMEVLTFWRPHYWFSGGIKLITAGASVMTALVLPPLVPRVRGIVSAAKDAVRTRRELELANAELIQERESRLRQLADAMPLIVWTARPEGSVDYFNRRWSEFTGLSFEKTSGTGWTQVIHPDDLDRCMETWSRSTATGEPYEVEYRFRRHDGTYRWFLGRALPVRDPAGAIAWWAGTATDIDDQKQLQSEHARLLTAEKSARADAEQANRAKDQFLAIVSHELRTPMTAILGWSSMLDHFGGRDAEMVANGIRMIRQSAAIQAQIIDDLLDVSRIATGVLQISFAPVDLAAVVREAADAIAPSAAAKQVRIDVAAPVPAIVEGDAGRLSQVVTNLLSNAIKFSNSGGRVAVAVVRSADIVQVIVSDRGRGIAADFLPNMFDRFTQEDSSSTRTAGGLGLGLAIVRTLVEMHSGTVKAESGGLGNGATFTVTLPSGALPASDADAEAILCSLAGVRILVVDDDEATREMVGAFLRSLGATVDSAGSVAAALAAVERARPGVVISDLAMPEQDGYELLRHLEPLRREHGLVVIVFSALHDAEALKEHALRFDESIRKPAEPALIAAAVGKAMRTAR